MPEPTDSITPVTHNLPVSTMPGIPGGDVGVLRVSQTSPARTAVNPYISELIHREQTLPCKISLRNSAPNCDSGSANSAEEKCLAQQIWNLIWAVWVPLFHPI